MNITVSDSGNVTLAEVPLAKQTFLKEMFLHMT